MSGDPDATRRALEAYYRRHARDLPWRRGAPSPYAIWISEIMLQQTQVATVTERFTAFLERFPTVETLAAAGEDAVCEAWAGLGYYRRARNLHRAAVCIVEQHDGRFPNDMKGLRELPGIGEYTAGAIASIAFSEQVPAVDGNAERVICRLLGLAGPPGAKRDRAVKDFASALARSRAPGVVNQALMDVSAAFCLPRSPRCEACPVEASCAARAAGNAESLPVKAEKRDRKRLQVAIAYVTGTDGRVLAEQRPTDGLWAGQWQLPQNEGSGAKAKLEKRLGVRLAIARNGREPIAVRHLLTHREVVAKVYTSAQAPERLPSRSRWRESDDTTGMSALARKALVAVTAAKSS